MRVLFVTRGSSGHLGPLVPFARACEAGGNEVLVAAQEQFGRNVERAGLPFAPFDAPPQEEWMPLMGRFAELDFQAANAVMVGDFFAGLDVSAELPRLDATVREWCPDLIVRESWEFGSTIVAERHGIPVARVGLGVSEVEREAIGLAAPRVDEARRSAGLPADPEGGRLADAPYLTMVPKSFDSPGPPPARETHRFRFAAGEPGPLPDWWPGDERPLVYLTFGSVAAGAHLPFYPGWFDTLIGALAPLPVRLLVTIGDPERDAAELGTLPANVHVETWVRHEDAAAASDAVVCHGGFGSTLGTVAHGKPLVVVPLFSTDQWANGEAVARSGAGLTLADDPAKRGALALPSEAVIERLAEAVTQALDDESMRDRAQEVADSMGSLPPADAAVEVLAAIARA